MQQMFMAISHFKSDYSDVVIQSIRDCPKVTKDIVCDSSFRQHRNKCRGVASASSSSQARLAKQALTAHT